MELQYPWMLAGCAAVPVLWWILKNRMRPTVVVATVLPMRSAKSRRRRVTLPEMCLLTALLLLSVALANPRRAEAGQVIRNKGVDIVLAVDLSGSMASIDRPRNMDDRELLSKLNRQELPDRLAAAKDGIRRFIEQRPNDRIGLIGFGNAAYSFVPPTLDHALVLERLRALKIGEIGDGTAFAAAIGLGVERLRKSDAPRRVLVIFTDGTPTVESVLTPEQAAALAAEFNISIHTVGIGGEVAYRLIQDFFGPRWAEERGSYNPALLKKVAVLTRGSFFEAADAEGFRRVMQEIDRLEKTDIESPRPVIYRDYGTVIGIMALAILFFGVISGTTWRLRLP